MVNNIGRNRVRDLIKDDVSSMMMGEDGSDVTITQTDLIAGVEATRLDATVTISNQSLTASYFINPAQGNSETYAESGLYLNSDAVMFNRVVFPDFEKTDKNELTIKHVINIL